MDRAGIYRFSRLAPQIMSLLALTVCAMGWAWFALVSIAFGGRLLSFGQPVRVAQDAADVSPGAAETRPAKPKPKPKPEPLSPVK